MMNDELKKKAEGKKIQNFISRRGAAARRNTNNDEG
jgi:hypothetical protein